MISLGFFAWCLWAACWLMQGDITQCVGNSIITPVGMQMTVGLRSSKYTFMIASMKIVPLFRLMLLILSFPYTSTVKSISVDVIALRMQYIRVRGLSGGTWVRSVTTFSPRVHNGMVKAFWMNLSLCISTGVSTIRKFTAGRRLTYTGFEFPPRM